MSISLTDRFWNKVDRNGANGCWNWIASLGSSGYGRFNHEGKTQRAHRVSYLAAKGPIPEGMQLDHLCRNRRCVNPDHLEAVTPLENMHRSMAPAMVIIRSGRCIRGHDLPNGGRCRICERMRRQEDRRRKAAERGPYSVTETCRYCGSVFQAKRRYASICGECKPLNARIRAQSSHNRRKQKEERVSE